MYPVSVTPFSFLTSLVLAISLTFFYTIYQLWKKPLYRLSTPIQVYLMVAVEVVVVLLWITTFITMLLRKGKNFRKLFETPPYHTWVVAAAAAVLEV